MVRAKVQGRTPRSFLKAVTRRLLEKVAYGKFDLYELENYRLAAMVVDAVRDGRSNPYQHCIDVHYNGRAPKPFIPPTPFTVSAETYFKQKEVGTVLPEHVDGRDSKAWVASIAAYLHYRITSTTSKRHEKLNSPYFAALIVVDRQQRELELPELYRRRSNSTEQPTVITARIGERPALTQAARVLA